MMNISEQFFFNYRRTQIPIITADSDSTLMATGIGDVQVKLFDQSKGKLVTQRLHEVLRVPGLSSNLISASALVQRGNSTSHIRLENKKALIHLNNNVIQANMNSKGMFKLHMTLINNSHQSTSMLSKALEGKGENKILELHRRLAHKSLTEMKKLVRMTSAINICDKTRKAILQLQQLNCSDCTKGKSFCNSLPIKGENAAAVSFTAIAVAHSDDKEGHFNTFKLL
jgi:hypothetical protein